jgi:Kef-type K+ transport system membrane component KefB/mannitol/fructose-specific phosphotransferase system IIA component
MFVALGVLLAAARVLGEIAQWRRQPAVLGELLAGVLLGPTVLGRIAPDWSQAFFPLEGPNATALSAFSTLSIALFLLVAGMEVELSTAWRQGAAALKIALAGMAIPFAVGLAAAVLTPGAVGRHPQGDPAVFALFLATALAISALPVIAKTLMDLNLFRTDLGVTIISAAVINDLVGWIVFAVVLAMIGGGFAAGAAGVGTIVLLTLCFAAGMLTVVRWGVHRALPWIQAYTHWPGGVLSFSLAAALFAAALAEWIGVHAIFGAFLMGVAIGDSTHLRQQTRTTIEHFTSFFFAPLFFAGIGLKVDFLANFDPLLVLLILAIACAGKLLGCRLGARWAGLSERDAVAVSFAMNARGAMEIILGLLALERGVIDQRLFVALVVMALATTLLAGPMVQWSLGWKKPLPLAKLLNSRCFIRPLHAVTSSAAITELVRPACEALGGDPDAIESAVRRREAMMPTGVGNRIALPHARLPGLDAPLVAVGISERGVDFDAPDGLPAQVVFLILTPLDDGGAQLDVMARLARIFADSHCVERALETETFTEFVAFLNAESNLLASPSAAGAR